MFRFKQLLNLNTCLTFYDTTNFVTKEIVPPLLFKERYVTGIRESADQSPPTDFWSSRAESRNSSTLISLKKRSPCVVRIRGLTF